MLYEVITRTAPDVSFGPRWTATAGAQDMQCLTCHEQDTASNWRHSLHMLNNITCVTCHDILTWEDEVLVAADVAQGIEAFGEGDLPHRAPGRDHEGGRAHLRLAASEGVAEALVSYNFV